MDKISKILIADDEIEIREILARVLSKKYAITFASNGAEALQSVQDDKPDAVLLDLKMPVMGGLEACQKIRANAANNDVLIFILTALGDQESRQKCFEVGADDHMTKPFGADELLVRIESKLRRLSTRPRPLSDDRRPKEARQLGNLTIDKEKRVTIESVEVQLRQIEFLILSTLVDNYGSVCTRQMLSEKIWGAQASTDRNLDPHISSLRQRLAAFDHEIFTRHRMGYELRLK